MVRTATGLLLLPLLLFPAVAFGLTTAHFESPHVHPAELSPDGTKLLVVHTAGHELAVFDLTGPSGPVRIGKVPVGYEPVTVRMRSDTEAWVVSHISDAISVVDLTEMNVVRTLFPGDEPTDVVFAEAQNRAFVAVSQQDEVAVFDLQNLDAAPVSIALDHSDPRSLALSPDGSTVYVAALDSQNETTSIPWRTVLNGGGPPAPNPPMDPNLPAPPNVALIVRHDGTAWRDESGAAWSLPYTLLDHDVIEISTSTLAVTGFHRGVGTALFNIAVHPVTGVLYVTNQEAFNEIRFEPNLNARFAQMRVTTIDPATGTVTPVHLNGHIDYSTPTGNPTERALSLSIPLDLEFSSAGTELYVAAMGSRKVGVLDAAGNVTRRIDVGEGPSGLALDEARNALYVVNRFTSTLSVVDLSDDSSWEIPLGFDPSHPDILDGRKFVYDGQISSGHGDLSCATCHVFSRMDGIAWDLGNPIGTFLPPRTPPPPVPPGQGFHPMKGPMVTQTLQGLGGQGGIGPITNTLRLHWRGERATLDDFNVTFPDLQGAPQLTSTEMQAFEAFVETIHFPPPPNRNLDGSHFPLLGAGDPTVGENDFQSTLLFGQQGAAQTCVSCHRPPLGNRDTPLAPQHTDGNQDMTTIHLRNQHEKTRFDNTGPTSVRGFGFTHDGAFARLFDFFTDFDLFHFGSDQQRLDVEAAMLAFDTETNAALGAQWTMDGTNQTEGNARLAILEAEEAAGELGLIAKGRDGTGQQRGWVKQAGTWLPDRSAEPSLSTAALVAMAGPATEITFTAVLPDEQFRLGVDRDDDTFLDRDELDIGSDPDDPASTPVLVGAPEIAGAPGGSLWLLGANPARNESRLGFRILQPGSTTLSVYDVTGRRVRSLVDRARHRAGAFESVWDLRNDSGERVAAGLYYARLIGPATVVTRPVVVLR